MIVTGVKPHLVLSEDINTTCTCIGICVGTGKGINRPPVGIAGISPISRRSKSVLCGRIQTCERQVDPPVNTAIINHAGHVRYPTECVVGIGACGAVTSATTRTRLPDYVAVLCQRYRNAHVITCGLVH